MTMDLNYNNVRDRATGAIIGSLIGDAMGLPVEDKSSDEIQKLFGYIDTYVSNEYQIFANIRKRSPGTLSDDSQLTLAFMDSLIRCKGYNLKDLIMSYIEAYDGKFGRKCGWRDSAALSCEKMKRQEKPFCSQESSDNTVATHISPFALYCVYQTLFTQEKRFTDGFNASLLKKCQALTELYYSDPSCAVATYCQCRMIIRAVQDEIPETFADISQLFIVDAEYAESKIEHIKWKLSDAISRLLDTCNEGFYDYDTRSISKALGEENYSSIKHSYLLVIYCISKYSPYRNFQYAVTETINAGGDSDSNGAMVGAFMGAQLGYHNIPSELVRGLTNYQKLMRFTQNFVQSL